MPPQSGGQYPCGQRIGAERRRGTAPLTFLCQKGGKGCLLQVPLQRQTDLQEGTRLMNAQRRERAAFYLEIAECLLQTLRLPSQMTLEG